MAVPAILLDDPLVVLVHLDVVGKFARREGQRMEEPIPRFAVILANEIVRRMAVVAGGELAMRRLDPRIVLRTHHVAVHARGRVVGHIGRAVGISEREQTQACCCADQHRRHDVQQRHARDNATRSRWNSTQHCSSSPGIAFPGSSGRYVLEPVSKTGR